MDHDLSKLPKWAQDKINILESTLRSVKEEMEQSTKPESTRLVVWGMTIDGGLPDGERGLPEYATVRFYLGDERDSAYIDFKLIDDESSRRRAKRHVRVVGHAFVSGRLQVLPSSGNSIDLEIH